MRAGQHQGAVRLGTANQPEDAHSAGQAGNQRNRTEQRYHVADLNSGLAATMYSTPDQIVVSTANQATAAAA